MGRVGYIGQVDFWSDQLLVGSTYSKSNWLLIARCVHACVRCACMRAAYSKCALPTCVFSASELRFPSFFMFPLYGGSWFLTDSFIGFFVFSAGRERGGGEGVALAPVSINQTRDRGERAKLGGERGRRKGAIIPWGGYSAPFGTRGSLLLSPVLFRLKFRFRLKLL